MYVCVRMCVCVRVCAYTCVRTAASSTDIRLTPPAVCASAEQDLRWRTLQVQSTAAVVADNSILPLATATAFFGTEKSAYMLQVQPEVPWYFCVCVSVCLCVCESVCVSVCI